MKKNWIISETENYIFHYRKGSVAQKEIENIINTQENCNKYITKVLGTKLDKKIKYFLCDSREEVGELYGDNDPCNGFARMPNEIYAVYNEDIKCIGYHEDAHIISYTIARPKQAFIREGLAMYFDKMWWGIWNEAWVKYYLDNNKLPDICHMMDDDNFFEYSCELTYPLAGAFIQYLIDTYGIEIFKKLYKNLEEDAFKAFNEFYGRDLEDIQKEFMGYINNMKINEKIIEAIEEELM
ncbi:hypothetical protein [Haloimpatiens lingqiaonensis]|uniref:hypothetical protein n=1 Tax=Haloimpatiens lingqiaonensis TaxID=1380675 RepID=UPI0010FF4030|nr:hypothetical protein [Haloimpatiens lingqiaonensis]